MSAIGEATEILDHHFPGVPVIPNIGNNDPPFHYQGPTEAKDPELKDRYYGDLWQMWAKDLSGNHIDTPENEKIFKATGSFISEIAPGLKVISLNSLYWSNRMPDQTEEAQELMDWLEGTLLNAGNNE